MYIKYLRIKGKSVMKFDGNTPELGMVFVSEKHVYCSNESRQQTDRQIDRY